MAGANEAQQHDILAWIGERLRPHAD